MNLRLMNLSWENDSMRKLEEEMRSASQTDASVMLTGESGVGKRFAANMIHELSHRRRAPFVAINAAAVWDTGPYTAGDMADPLTEGLLQARNGTLFIQDIEKISASAQLQLFRFMDWATTPERRVRFLTATGTDLFSLVQTGKFREDLYYRLNVFCFVIPPLRERPEDIPLIFQHYLSLHTRTEVPPLSSAARQRLVEYSWPGNIRELRTVTRKLSAERLPDLIEPEHLPCPIGE
jgi:DNA-binding NtrC family response regulator